MARSEPAGRAAEGGPDAEMEACFFELLEMDRESDAFLDCFRKLDRMLDAALGTTLPGRPTAPVAGRK